MHTAPRSIARLSASGSQLSHKVGILCPLPKRGNTSNCQEAADMQLVEIQGTVLGMHLERHGNYAASLVQTSIPHALTFSFRLQRPILNEGMASLRGWDITKSSLPSMGSNTVENVRMTSDG